MTSRRVLDLAGGTPPSHPQAAWYRSRCSRVGKLSRDCMGRQLSPPPLSDASDALLQRRSDELLPGDAKYVLGQLFWAAGAIGPGLGRSLSRPERLGIHSVEQWGLPPLPPHTGRGGRDDCKIVQD